MLPVGPLSWKLGLTHWLFVPTYTLITGEMIYQAHGTVPLIRKLRLTLTKGFTASRRQ